MSDIIAVERRPTDTEINKIARKWLFRCLCRIDYETCKEHKGGIELPGGRFNGDVEEAAAELKALGGSWEEWT
jgi:hypothetical protein